MKRRGLGPATVALALAFGLSAHAAGSDEVAYARATALARSGRCPEALAVLAELSTQTARSADLRGQCQIEAKDWPAALASLEQAKQLDPATPGVELHLAVARFHMGDYEGARDALDLAAITAQDDPEYHLYRGLVLLQQARSEEAADELGRARALRASAVEPGASYYEGLAWASARETEKARAALDRVIQSAPGTPWAAEAERAKAELARIAEGRGNVWVMLQGGFEYDNNVRLRGTDAFPSNEANHDVRAVWLLHGGYRVAYGDDWAAGTAFSYYGSLQKSLEDFDEHYPVFGLWYDRRLAEATTLRLTYDVGYAWYQGDPFVFTQQARASLFQDFGAAGRTELFATPYRYDYLYPLTNVQDGPGTVGGPCPDPTRICGPAGLDEKDERNRDGYGVATGLEHRLPLGVLGTELFAGASYLYYGARGSEYSYGGVGGWLGTDTELPFATALRTSFGYSYLGYRHASTYPDPSDPALTTPTTQYALAHNDRNDNRWSFAVELEKSITERWATSVRYSYENNNSNVAVFDYDREIIGVYVTYRLKR